MTKAALFSIGLAALLGLPAIVSAQDSAVNLAVNQAVLNQANTIVLRNKLADARVVAQRGDIAGAAKLYQESFTLAQQIGSGIDAETEQAKAGLAFTRLTLARDARSRGDLREADVQIQQVLKADPKNNTAILFKQQNDQLLALNQGRMPDLPTLDRVPQIGKDKIEAGTLVQDGKLLYEMGKYDESESKLNEALKQDPDNKTAYYYLSLNSQAKLARDGAQHTVDTQKRMEHVEKQWILPTPKVNLPVPNSYATNNLIYTGPGRQIIMAKLDRIHLDNIAYDGLPLGEVLRNLSEQAKLRDPERKGINFIINPNADQSGQPVAARVNTGFGGAGGFGGAPGFGAAAPAVDPATGLQAAPGAPEAGATTEALDISTIQVKLNLTDVRLADVLEAICLVADHPIKYSVQDFAVVFQAKGAENPVLLTRTFKVDPNTFYSGLESVGAQSFGSSQSSGGGGGGGGSRGGGGGGGGSSQNNGAVVGVVNAFSGSGGLRNTGTGGGGGGGGSGTGAINPLAAGGGGGGGGNVAGGGGLQYITQVTMASTVSAAARQFFTTLGVNLEAPPGKSVFFNDRSGLLLVRATEQDLDTIERAIQMLNQVAPQVHIKSRFIEVQQTDSKALGLDWMLGQFNMGNNVVGTGGTAPSATVTPSSSNPSGVFPGLLTPTAPNAATDQLLTSGLRNSAPTLATFTGIMTDPNFRVVLHALEQRGGFENLAEPEITTTSGRQTQMRATQVITIIVDMNFQQGTAASIGNGGAGVGQ